MFLTFNDVLEVDMVFSCSWQGKGGKPAGSMVCVRMNMCWEIQVYLRNGLSSFNILDQAHTENGW